MSSLSVSILDQEFMANYQNIPVSGRVPGLLACGIRFVVIIVLKYLRIIVNKF